MAADLGNLQVTESHLEAPVPRADDTHDLFPINLGGCERGFKSALSRTGHIGARFDQCARGDPALFIDDDALRLCGSDVDSGCVGHVVPPYFSVKLIYRRFIMLSQR